MEKQQNIKKQLSAKTLQDELWSVFQRVRDGEMEPRSGLVLTMAAREITSIARLQMRAIEFKATNPNAGTTIAYLENAEADTQG